MMMSMSTRHHFKAVIFDLWGVLLTIDRRQQYEYWSEKLGVPVDRLLAAVDVYHADMDRGTLTADQLWQNVATDLGITIDPAISIGLWDHYYGVGIRSELIHLADQLRSRGYKLGILTNLGHPPRQAPGIYPHFDVVVQSYQEGVVKPEPAAFGIVLDRLGVEAADTVFIDDVVINVDGAEAVGIEGIVFEDSTKLFARLHDLGFKLD